MSKAPAIRTRVATERDGDFVAGLATDVFGHLGPSYGDWSREWMLDSRVGTMIAMRGRKRLGYVMVASAISASGQRMIANLLAIAVIPEARREGIGRLLVQTAIDVVANAPVEARERRLELTVAEDNPSARSLFESFDFKTVPGGASVYPLGQRSFTMSRTVEPQPAQTTRSNRRVAPAPAD